ncbi:hypothetical protein COO60DRAFT_1650237 [Scenedesmus sp. NREL 46B-D3]|nr:hypothetical protein COO60DRAFT_1650237 [Scenedesmus sp. NREL 46B-D3]
MAAAPEAADGTERLAFEEQVAAQTEQLLWLAHKLQLQPLVQRLYGFIRSLSYLPTSVLHDEGDDVFSSRVLEMAGVASLPAGKQMLLNSVRGELVTFTYQISGAARICGPQA